MRATTAFALLALLASTNADPAESPTVESLSASGNLSFVSRDGCIENDVTIFVNKTVAPPGASKAVSYKTDVTYSRLRYDLCTDSDLGTDLGSTSTAEVSGDLKSVHLVATVDGIPRAIRSGFDAAIAPVRISFSLTWIGAGDINHLSHHVGTATNVKAAARPDRQSRSAWIGGQIDGAEVSSGSIGSILLTARRTATR